MISTEMTEDDMVFGGTDKLLDAVSKIREMNPRPGGDYRSQFLSFRDYWRRYRKSKGDVFAGYAGSHPESRRQSDR